MTRYSSREFRIREGNPPNQKKNGKTAILGDLVDQGKPSDAILVQDSKIAFCATVKNSRTGTLRHVSPKRPVSIPNFYSCLVASWKQMARFPLSKGTTPKIHARCIDPTLPSRPGVCVCLFHRAAFPRRSGATGPGSHTAWGWRSARSSRQSSPPTSVGCRDPSGNLAAQDAETPRLRGPNSDLRASSWSLAGSKEGQGTTPKPGNWQRPNSFPEPQGSSN